MSHTNYNTCTSSFHVKNIESFIRALHRANIRPIDEDSDINANYIFDKTNEKFIISGHFDGNIGTFDSETGEQRDRKLIDLIRIHADLSRGEKEILIITNFEEVRRSRIINTGVWIDKVYKSSQSNKRFTKTIANSWTNN